MNPLVSPGDNTIEESMIGVTGTNEHLAMTIELFHNHLFNQNVMTGKISSTSSCHKEN